MELMDPRMGRGQDTNVEVSDGYTLCSALCFSICHFSTHLEVEGAIYARLGAWKADKISQS